MTNNELKYEFKEDIVIIHFPEKYWIENWGKMLELIRNNEISGAKYIIIDLSEVKQIDDCGLEFYILRDEFRETGGKDVIISGMSDFFKSILKLLDEEKVEEKIRKYNNVKEALDSIKDIG